ncbi:hypothetical protein NJR55_06645 [Idiomarina sp. M1R2S28]|uniref:Uncharacterized protein n=1 Tax=Idiomarina rhizosphaerae TaxID=2961572 RepID=A0A9X2JSY2_9GAMM|nr:hypothetical protein [Idiomarina rhizosphaerae]MCP1339270.1 hypothetical protein [Idiomarina rhizosphaerae]
MVKAIFNNFEMISPLPMLWWLSIGLIAQWIHPSTLLNSDNVSITTLQFGLVLAFVLSMAALWLSFLWEDKPSESKFLKFLYNSSRQFMELAMGVAGFSAAYFLLSSVFWLPVVLMISSVVLAVCANHIFLITFNKTEIGTYKLVLLLDERFGTEWNSFGSKVVAGFFALVAMVIVGGITWQWLKA